MTKSEVADLFIFEEGAKAGHLHREARWSARAWISARGSAYRRWVEWWWQGLSKTFTYTFDVFTFKTEARLCPLLSYKKSTMEDEKTNPTSNRSG